MYRIRPSLQSMGHHAGYLVGVTVKQLDEKVISLASSTMKGLKSRGSAKGCGSYMNAYGGPALFEIMRHR